MVRKHLYTRKYTGQGSVVAKVQAKYNPYRTARCCNRIEYGYDEPKTIKVMKGLTKLENAIAMDIAGQAEVGSKSVCSIIELEDGTTAEASGKVHVDGYVEDDFVCGYGNGTGAFVTTNVECCLYIEAYDCDNNAIEVDTASIEDYVINYLFN